jgi:hypothetical protein
LEFLFDNAKGISFEATIFGRFYERIAKFFAFFSPDLPMRIRRYFAR